jgi:hypothetical protein
MGKHLRIAVVPSSFNCFEKGYVLSEELEASPLTVNQYFFLRFLTVWSTETGFVTCDV